MANLRSKWSVWLNARSQLFWLLFGTLLLVAAGWLDFIADTEINVTIFYLFPVGLAAWYAGKWNGGVLSVLGALIWYAADWLAGHHFSSHQIAIWDTLVSFIFFLLAGLGIARFRAFVEKEKVMSRVDFLTGLCNRRGFYELARREMARCQRQSFPLTVAFMDCDRFKSVNDQWGHHAGDELLSIIGKTLQRSLRSTDVAARMGGDEFAILLPELEPPPAPMKSSARCGKDFVKRFGINPGTLILASDPLL